MRYILAGLALCFTLTAQASGPNDGIYVMTYEAVPDYSDFVSIHQNGDTILFITLDPSDFTWEVLQGVRQGNQASLQYALGGNSGSVVLMLEFLTATTAALSLEACSADPGSVCNFPDGAQFDLIKAF